MRLEKIDFSLKDNDLQNIRNSEIKIDDSWATLAERSSQAEIKPELVQTEDEEIKNQIQRVGQRIAEAQAKKTKMLSNLEMHFGRPVLGKILILPISGARQFTYSKPWAAISIASWAPEFPVLSGLNRIALLQLTFEDLDAIPGPEFAKKFPSKANNIFKEEHADKILDFICDYWTQIDLLMIHCYAGASRSPAIGKAISDCLQPKWSPYFDRIFQPNKLVYDTIKDVYQKKFEVYDK